MTMLESDPAPDLYDRLSDALWHPIMSPLSIQRGKSTTFWVSPHFEYLGKDGPIHDNADGYRIDFESDGQNWAREGDALSAIGRTALISIPHRLRLVTFGERAYVRLEQELAIAAESTYKQLMRHAAFVGGMPFETPLRWQRVHGMNVLGGVGGEVAKYVMGDFGDGRNFTIYHEMGEQAALSGPWRLTSKIPPQDHSDNYLETTITNTDTRPSVSKYTMTPSDACLAYEKGGVDDVVAFIDLMKEAADVLPQKQREFFTAHPHLRSRQF